MCRCVIAVIAFAGRGMGVYENIVLGNFLFGFGAHVGARIMHETGSTRGLPLAINLLQQTPLDPVVSDLVVSGSRMMRIVEFKREENKDDGEAEKRANLELLLSGDPELLSISRQVHWYAWSGPGDPQNCGIEMLCPYLDFQSTKKNKRVDLNKFFEKMADEALSDRPNQGRVFTRYLNALASVSEAKGSATSGGFIFSMSEDGKVNYAKVDDFRFLGRELKQMHAQFQQKKLQYEHQQKLERTLERDRGLSL